MAEDDWYGPFARLKTFSNRHWTMLIALTAGLLNLVAGFIGYDTGKRWSTATIPAETRWMGRVLWDQIVFSIILFAVAFYCYRTLPPTKK